ncbi:hypothetical protein BE20_41995 [Sorangium cellulosum]|uniref:Uncharacterized protein n=1 Tax=Sorangium cellulosum TaxID=56 RepID=A0A150T5I2_SORCE|nr:hypothetical protein BE20_41995 [Sorangium cellulosum]KYF99992.1 hypothetical protein BE18_14360 [Sorangium cellulosum]
MRRCSGGVRAEIDDEQRAPALDDGSADPTEAHQAAWCRRKRHADRRPIRTRELFIEIGGRLSTQVSDARSAMTFRIEPRWPQQELVIVDHDGGCNLGQSRSGNPAHGDVDCALYRLIHHAL